MIDAIVGFAVGILGNYVATVTQPPIPNLWQRRLDEQLADDQALRKALSSTRSFRDEVRRACRELSRDRALIGNLSPQEREVWLLLSDARFAEDLADWLMAGGLEEAAPVRERLESVMEHALLRGGALQEQIATFKATYFEMLDRTIFTNPVLAAWRHQRSLDYLREQVVAIKRAAEQVAGIYSEEVRQAALERYLVEALREWDIIDLSNLPEGDIDIATQRLLLRQLYVPLRVTVEVDRERAAQVEAFDVLEARREARRRREAGWIISGPTVDIDPQERVPVGERLGEVGRLVVLGDPGGGKTTLLRWMATAYLLSYRNDPTAAHLPDVETLPQKRWIPVLIRCRDLGEADLSRSFVDFLAQHLLKSSLHHQEAEVMRSVILERITKGEVLLLVDGLDEITNPQVRIQFCQELERTAARYRDVHFVVTSRIVGYRDMPYRMGNSFEHSVIADLTREDKDLFAQRWIDVTEQHQPPRERDKRVEELIEALHSSDRIERLTGNPMLLTTLALVKRKVGKLPSRRNKLYAEAVSVLLNWNPRHYQAIDEAEAIPQLAYIAYEMCRRGVQRLGEQDVFDLLDRIRQEYLNVRALRQRSPEEFLTLLEARSSILIKSGDQLRANERDAEAVWEFRHLTLQEYLAAQALLSGRYPDRNKQNRLADEVAPLAGTLSELRRPLREELQVSDSWQETLRLLVADARDDDVDEVLLAILEPMEGEDPTRTARPRAVLAARCLADEPNVVEETAERVLSAFVAQISQRDGDGLDATSLDGAAFEVGHSIWGELLKHHLMREFFERTSEDYINCGGLYAMVVELFAPNEGTQLRNWLDQRVIELDSYDDRVVASAALAIMQLAYSGKIVEVPELVNKLLGLLQRLEPTRMAAAWALWWLCDNKNDHKLGYIWQPTKDEVLILIDALQSPQTSKQDTSRWLINIFGNIRTLEIFEPVLVNLDDLIAEARQAIVKALGQLKNVGAVEPLLARLDDPDVNVRRAVVTALGQLGDERGVEPLLARLDDPEENVRQAIVEVLGQLGDARVVEPLLVRLNNNKVHERIRLTIAVVLARHGAQRGIQELIKLLTSEKRKTRISAIEAFANTRDEITGQLLSRDVDALAPWLDPAEPITLKRVAHVAEQLEISDVEVQAQYEALAAELPLRLAWRKAKGDAEA